MKSIEGTLIAVLRIRGEVGVRDQIKQAMNLMKLHRKNRVILLKNTQSNVGMINKVKDYCTFGEVDAELVKELLEKRGRTAGNKQLTADYLKKEAKTDFYSLSKALVEGKASLKDIPGLKRYFKMHPPVGGFERGGVKHPFAAGGALGYRGKEMSKLIQKMI
ncbi:50S ribosomal protein L30 [Candidatus Woesearchaeota archaeon]|jgi:large subunit ribosomal protein L30|nr:50S ribosomal protein L30 [Candidatus Woesearchaeota archaeon]MBT6023295.1 50S ribosomal protein L30 [Candidatus Woesearchaeota archaeon]